MAEWDTAYVNDLPDSAFAVILPGGEKDESGRTVPRSLRKLPHHDASGSVDLPHLRNALSRESQADMTAEQHDAAHEHLEAHAEAEDVGEPQERSLDDATVASFLDRLAASPENGATIAIRDLSRREIGMRLLPWETPVLTRDGPEVIMRGAFDDTDPTTVVLRLEHENPPAGLGVSYANRDDGPYMVFRASKTQRGDDILTLAQDGVTKGVSVGYEDVPGGTQVYMRGGKRLRVVHRGALREVSTTWRPTWKEAAVEFVRSEGDAPMPEIEAPVVETPDTSAVLERALTSVTSRMGEQFDKLADRLEKIEERSRADIIIPTGPTTPERPQPGEWMQAVLRMLSGERVNDLQLRTLDDLITSDNIGVVPPAYSTEIIGVINRRRPFMESTRRLGTPTTGMSLVVPRIVTRPTVEQQLTEKYELSSKATAIDTVTFDAVTKGGAGDISLQLLKRSSPSFLGLYLELLAEAYAAEAEVEAVEALLASGSGSDIVNDAGDFDPEDPNFGEAWLNGYGAMYGGPDTLWLSSAAVAAFIDAKANTTNQPLYSNLQANITAAGGLGGNVSGLRPVHVPALNSTAYDVLVGPSNGFGWAEDGTYTLQVDVPAKAGRDVAMVGILWFAPLYPSAFTAWALAGS